MHKNCVFSVFLSHIACRNLQNCPLSTNLRVCFKMFVISFLTSIMISSHFIYCIMYTIEQLSCLTKTYSTFPFILLCMSSVKKLHIQAYKTWSWTNQSPILLLRPQQKSESAFSVSFRGKTMRFLHHLSLRYLTKRYQYNSNCCS